MSANTAEKEVEPVDDADDDMEYGQDSETDNVGDASVELNVEALINELEADGLIACGANGQAAKRRLEELMEMRRSRKDLEDFDDYDV